jgi:hypothetical protein
MLKHFLFEPGNWLGTGQVTFSFSPDLLYFRTKWSTVKPDDESFQSTQTVEIIGGDRMVNIFIIKPIDQSSFDIVLQNELLGVFSGTGVIEPNLIAWEFRNPGTLEGYEVYERLQEQEYSMHAEYLSSDGSRTLIRGKIWKATEQTEEASDEEAIDEEASEES